MAYVLAGIGDDNVKYGCPTGMFWNPYLQQCTNFPSTIPGFPGGIPSFPGSTPGSTPTVPTSQPSQMTEEQCKAAGWIWDNGKCLATGVQDQPGTTPQPVLPASPQKEEPQVSWWSKLEDWQKYGIIGGSAIIGVLFLKKVIR